MSINNINNLPTFGNAVNLTGTNSPIASEPSAADLSKGNIDWFSSAGTGKALPISAQAQFNADTPLDDMVSVMMGHLGL